jgi:hypothetical protein
MKCCVRRHEGERPFNEHDVGLLGEAAPMLGAALRRSLARAVPDDAIAARAPGLNNDLRPIAETAEWRGRVCGFWDAAGDGLPGCEAPPFAGSASAVRTLELASDGTWIVVEGATLEGAGEARLIVTLRRASSDETFDRLCRLYGLTPPGAAGGCRRLHRPRDALAECAPRDLTPYAAGPPQVRLQEARGPQSSRARRAIWTASRRLGFHERSSVVCRDIHETRKPAPEAGFRRLRGKDSNLDYLIQSQASYH